MLKRFQELSVASSLVVLALLGVFAVLLYSGARIAQDISVARDLNRDAARLHLAPALGALTHAMQRERGASSGFIASGGARFSEELDRLRIESDAAVLALKAAAEREATSHSEALAFQKVREKLIAQLGTLDAIRAEVTARSIDRVAAVGLYTAINTTAIELLSTAGRSVAYWDVARAAQRQTILMSAKDIAGLERASGAAGFAQAHRTGGTFPQEIYASFESLAS